MQINSERVVSVTMSEDEYYNLIGVITGALDSTGDIRVAWQSSHLDSIAVTDNFTEGEIRVMGNLLDAKADVT